MISAVARAMDPGCQADHMLILEGKQGIGKSQALRILGGGFYTEYSGGVRGGMQKDMVAVIIGKMIVEMSELASIRRADMETLKAILTTTCDDARLAYERDAKAYPRTCVFAGTTNEVGQAYIADTSGARRFWPTLCAEAQPMNIMLLRADVDQLWAEATEAYEAGENWWEVPAELVSAEQTDRQITLEDSEPWFGKIRHALTDPDSYTDILHVVDEFRNGQPTGEFVVRAGELHHILGILLGIETARQSALDVLRVQKVLRGIGFKKTRPSRRWFGGTYAYDLTKDMVPHLWSSINAARKTIKFPKDERTDQKSSESGPEQPL